MTVSIRGGGQGDTPSPPHPQNNPTNQTGTAQDPNQSGDSTTQAGQDELSELLLPSGEPSFPLVELSKLDEMINRARWVVPVLPKGELEVLLEFSIRLCRAELDTKSEDCQKFFRDGLTTSFHKILNDEAVHGWKYEIHKAILKNTEKLVELCVTKLSQDWFPLLDLLALAFNPMSRFNVYNAARPSDTVPQGSQIAEGSIYAQPPDARSPKGWLVDLVNRFGALDGFCILQDRICNGGSLSVPLLAALLRPFGSCAELLTAHTVEKHFLPVIESVPKFLENLTDDELKKEAKNEAKNDALSSIIKALKNLAGRLSSREDIAKQLETFRLKMILRLLQISSFNGKMNALNEINKVITSVSYYTHRHATVEEEEWLTAERMAEWIQKNDVLSIVLKDNLHQPQYVEKLEKILRFVIKEKALSLQDLDNIWAAQAGKHDAIVKNVHDLLAKLAWDFSAEQLEHLFSCFQGSWTNATKKQREKLLELIRRLAEDDKEGVMAHKVLGLLWNLAHSDDVPTDIMDLALNAHIKILDYSCSQDRDSQKTQWIDRCVSELRSDTWVLPALKQIREICLLFYEAPQNYSHTQRNPHVYYRHEVINQLQQNHNIVTLVSDNLATYIAKAHSVVKLQPTEKNEGLCVPSTLIPDGRYNHTQQVQERLNFFRFLLKDGQLWLCEPQATQIWRCLAEKALFPEDRECCFKWFSKLMGEEQDLDPEISRTFFEGNILQLDPSLLTENGIRCFERFFRGVNSKEGKLVAKRRTYLIEDLDLIGVDYLWKVVLHSTDDIAASAIELLKETYTNLGPSLRANQVDIHEKFIENCTSRVRQSADLLLQKKLVEANKHVDMDKEELHKNATKIVRCLTVLKEYVAECDDSHAEERSILAHGRSCRGRHVSLCVRFPAHGRQGEEFELWSHDNESVASVRRHILHRVVKGSAQAARVDLYVNGELLCPADDKKLVSQVPLRDRMLITAKMSPVNNSMASSPDSSSDSSTESTPTACDGPNVEAENCLPGVIMSKKHKFIQYLMDLADQGILHGIPELRDKVQQLLCIIPSDTHVVERILTICKENGENSSPVLSSLFFISSPTQVLYNLEVVYSLLMPAGTVLESILDIQQIRFLRSGGLPCVMNMLTKPDFLQNADVITRRGAFLAILKIAKLLFTTMGYAQVQVVAEAIHPSDSSSATLAISASVHNAAVVLQQALLSIPNPTSECILRNNAVRLAQFMGKEMTKPAPDLIMIKSVQKLAWASAGGVFHLVCGPHEEAEIHKTYEKPLCRVLEDEDIQVAREALEVLSICLTLCPSAQETLSKDKWWQCFIIDVLILCHSRLIRFGAAEQFFLMATRCSQGHRPMIFFITLLFTLLTNTVTDHPQSSQEFFSLLCRLLNQACINHAPLPNSYVLLNNEIAWLKKSKDLVMASEEGSSPMDEALLEGHMGITKELMFFQSPHKKFAIGCRAEGPNLIKELVEEFIFPASKIILDARNGNDEVWGRSVNPICSSPSTLIPGFDLLVTLCTGCLQNMQYLSNVLCNMYYSDQDCPLTEWEHVPPIGPRPYMGYVGLKNAGATCYMNSVIQQLFMIPELREGILGVDGALVEEDAELLNGEMEEKAESESTIDTGYQSEDSKDNDNDAETKDKEQEMKDYQRSVLKQIQFIFGHLAQSRLQFHVPRGFWKTFKLWGEPVNLREQHDALEFFNSLVDNLDESLKFLGFEPMFTKVLGGSFSDQKICKGCPHRFSREAPFIALNVDIRNHHNLLEAMDQFVKGDLLEGANAYHCEKCDKKVDTVKRLCIKKLPRIMAIQLKRFDYDWERECAVKFNDYFEFPREIEMEPFTEEGLAKRQGESLENDLYPNTDDGPKKNEQNTKYRLVGILVHSGQASGGHYYAYILQRSCLRESPQWYKFDDGEVSECRMDDDEEMKTQCFGGEYMGEVFDHMLKRMSYRRQKRWWNAYILFYERLDIVDSNRKIDLDRHHKMPVVIEKAVRKQNVHFLHNRTQFSPEYFQFMRKLVTANVSLENGPDSEGLTMISIQLLSKFLFTTGFHTKKAVRGPASEWHDAMCCLLRPSKNARLWFSKNCLFNHMDRFSEYLLECPSAEVRSAFSKILVFLAHFSRQDGPCFPYPEGTDPAIVKGLDEKASLSDHLLKAILKLLKKEVPEHGRHLQQYFHFFHMYAGLGAPEKQQLLQLGVPATFMLVAMDDGPGPPIRYQYAELGKLYAVVSQLVRCCDVSSRMQASKFSKSEQGIDSLAFRCLSAEIAELELKVDRSEKKCQGPPKPNPFLEGTQPLGELPPIVGDLLFNKTAYLKKLVEDSTASEETLKLLKFCSYENPHFSRSVLSELLWQVAYSYTYELKPYLELLHQMLLIQDSWQSHRIHNTLRGIPEDKEGLFDTIQRSKNHYQKRAYQCIKFMVLLFSGCPLAYHVMIAATDLKRKWDWAVEWLGEELDRRPYNTGSSYTYNNWSPPSPSNEASNGYFLERSNSARVTLAKACDLFPEEEHEEAEGEKVNSADESESPVSQDRQSQAPQEVDPSQKGPLEKGSSDKSAAELSEPTTSQDPEVDKTEEDASETKIDSKPVNEEFD